MSYSLVIHFAAGQGRYSLTRTHFSSECRNLSFVCSRGTTVAPSSRGLFKWSRAVQALCVLLLNYKIYHLSDVKRDRAQAFISGENGSIAATLDYALSKLPVWLIDMFGENDRQEPMIRRVVIRENPERKRPGPVILNINPNVLAPSLLHVFVDGKKIDDELVFFDLLESISAQLDAKVDEVKARAKIVANNERKIEGKNAVVQFNSLLREAFFSEAVSMLRGTDIFSPNQLKQSIADINLNSSFRSVAGRVFELDSQIDGSLTSSHRLGAEEESFLMAELSGPEPIRISTSVTTVSAILLINYLRFVDGYNIDLNFKFANTNEIVQRISTFGFYRPPDMCIMGLPPAAKLLSSQRDMDYAPMMIMPKVSNRVVQSQVKNGKVLRFRNSPFVLPTDQPTSASFYFDHLCLTGAVDRDRVNVYFREPDEINSLILPKEPDVRTILWFPHYHISRILNGCNFEFDLENESSSADSVRNLETVLFANLEFRSNIKRACAFDIAIRNAWLILRRGGPELEKMIDMLFADREYMEFFARCTGVDRFQWQCSDNYRKCVGA